MSDMSSVWMVGGAALLVIFGVAVWLFSKSRKFNLTDILEGQNRSGCAACHPRKPWMPTSFSQSSS
jgi:hypothetical protein